MIKNITKKKRLFARILSVMLIATEALMAVTMMTGCDPSEMEKYLHDSNQSEWDTRRSEN